MSPTQVTDASLTIDLLAAGWIAAGWLDIVGPAIAILFLVLQQVLTGKDPKEAPGKPGPPKPDAPPAPGPDAAEAAPQADLRSEVEEFLRRLGEEPETEEKAAADDEFDDEPAPEPPRRPIDPFEEPPRRPTLEPVVVAPVAPAPTPPPRPVVAETEKPKPSQLGTLRERHAVGDGSRLGRGVAASDERLEERLHQKFDHRLGKLSSNVAGPSDDPKPVETPSSAQRIRELLTTPGGVRDAVLLSEILRRPTDRF